MLFFVRICSTADGALLSENILKCLSYGHSGIFSARQNKKLKAIPRSFGRIAAIFLSFFWTAMENS
jgi:hypothetical protein